MVFSSPTFLFLFLPVIYLLNLAAPKWLRNPLLLLASLIFYGWGEPFFVLVMVASTLANYSFARWQDHARRCGRPRQRRLAMVLMVVVNIGLLLVYKYTDFLLGTINQVLRLTIPLPGIQLPIGISFFTFQAMSYVIDVYRQETPVQKKFSHLLLYISFFPQLIAGPIVKYHDVAAQIEQRQLSIPETAAGIRRFIVGLAKKLLVANMVGQVADRIFALDPAFLDLPAAWIGALAYAIQIYFDFSGYSDMAIGLGHMLGFTFKENFLYPYAANSLQDFWRRWHVSLSTWFKEYLYIPLGGNRKGLLRTGLNRVAVFFLTGLWHGASWTFVVWGLYHGFFLILETYRIIRTDRFPLRILRYLYTLLVVVCGFVIFRAETLAQGLAMLGRMVAGWQLQPAAQALLMEVLTPGVILTLLIAGIAATPLVPFLRRRLSDRSGLAVLLEPAGYVISAVLLVLCILALSASTYNPFIYYRF
jgi:alginate O-acetyltransferase complex protein AlgI